MAKFMYLFRSNPAAFRSMSPEQMQQIMKKWMDWKDTLDKNGHIQQLGDRLDGTGKVIRGKTKAVTDGPYVEVKDFIQGYMAVNAHDMEQALELARGCPILESDGSVEIREHPQGDKPRTHALLALFVSTRRAFTAVWMTRAL